MRALVLCLPVLLLVGCAASPPGPPPPPDPGTRIVLDQGVLTGFHDDADAHAWLGIPYARPPVDELRWRAPLPPVPHEGTLEALTSGGPCAQIGSPFGGAPLEVTNELWGSEDCLYLDIRAPARGGSNLPVMVWIHGGGNTAGYSGFYDGGRLATRHDLVVVTVNYRLGPLGWFHHPALAGTSPEDASGNYGTLDLIRALEWIRENIEAFGGDPDAVTLFGESAGATNIASLVVSPLARGLFRGAIMQSGSIDSTSVAEALHPQDHPEAPGAPFSSSEILLSALTTADCDRDCARRMAGEMNPGEQEAVLRGLDLPALFALYGRDGDGYRDPEVPTIIRDGSVLPRSPFPPRFGDRRHSAAVPMILGSNRDEPKIYMAFDPAHVVRFAGLPVWQRDPRLYELQAEYGALAWKVRGVDQPADQLHAAGVPVWTYRWDWDEEGSLATIDLSALVGASHGLEIPFVFGHFDLGPQTPLLFHEDNAGPRIALSERMMAYWAAFARELDPGRGADGLGTHWQPWAPEQGRTFLRLDTGPDGIAMEDGHLTLEALLQRLREDERFRSDAERCRTLEYSFRFTEDPLLEGTVDRLQCTPRRSAP